MPRLLAPPIHNREIERLTMRLRKEYAHPLGGLPKLHVLDPIEHRHCSPTFEEPHLYQVPHHRAKPDFHRIELVSHSRHPLGRGPMTPPHSGPRPEFFGLHTLLRRLSGARSLPRLDLGLRLRGWCGDLGHPVSPSNSAVAFTLHCKKVQLALDHVCVKIDLIKWH